MVDSFAAAAVAFDEPAVRSAAVEADKLAAAAAVVAQLEPTGPELAFFSTSDIVVGHTFAVVECKSAAVACS